MAICNKVAERLLNGSLFLVARRIAAVVAVSVGSVVSNIIAYWLMSWWLVAGHRTQVSYPLDLRNDILHLISQ